MVASDQVSLGRADVGALYEEHRGLLVGTAVGRFGIRHEDAETLVHDVFLAYIVKADEVIDARAWLVGAIGNQKKNTLPRPAVLRTPTLPPCASTRFLTIARPSPVPRMGEMIASGDR